ncbi:MAG: hypothetical protein JWQ25_3329 [Daejeonella sp.]|nr:hypothetical protein [Daejeonella sp.]
MEKPGVCGGFVGKEDEDFGVNGGTDATDETQKPAFPNIFKFILMDIIISFYLPKA